MAFNFDFLKPDSNFMKGVADAGPVLSFFGTINSAVGSYYAAQSKISSLQHQADMAAINERILERSAQSTMLAAEKEIGRLTMKAGKLKSAQRVSMAANGIALGEGSAAEVIASTDLMKEMDAITIFQNAVQNAWSIRTQGVNQKTAAMGSLAAASSISPLGQAAGSLLSGAGDVATNWYRLNRYSIP
jgi:hypothetical protein